MVNELIERHEKLSLHAEKLLEPIPKIREKVLYKVTIKKIVYWVVALDRTHPVDIQKTIEVYENKSFDQTRRSYLRPQDMELIPLETTMQIAVEQEEVLVTMYDLVFVSPVNRVVHCSG